MTHTVTADDNSWTSGSLAPGASYSRTFNAAGTYNYHCIFHSGIMSGTVAVTGSVQGTSVYANGTLLMVNNDKTIFIVYRNRLTGFGNYPAFTGLGFKLGNVIRTDVALTNSGYVVTTANASHPWGSWVKSGNTIYFVHESGLIPISSYDIFINNGGNPALVVPANVYDLRLNQLPLMVAGDARLQ
jgi:hypothetical protein